MNAAVNGRFLSRRVTGVERYGQEILRCLGDKLRVVRPASHPNGWRGHAWEQFILPRQLRSDEILWSPAQTGPLSVTNQVLTIHDLSPLEHPEWYRPAFSFWYRMLWPLLARRVKHIVVSSEVVRQKVLTRFALRAEQVVTIPAGVDLERFQPAATAKQKYVLFVGSLAPRKNLAGLLRAWDMLKDKHPDHWLMVAGTYGNVFSSKPSLWQGGRVKMLGYVPEADLPALYTNAALFILPSFDEGFGLPVLEALACGTPVLAANAGALPEVLGDAGLLFDPNEITDIAATIDRALCDDALRAHLRAAGLACAAQFSWRASAEKIWQALQA